MIEIKHIGKSADDLRFFILMDGNHAGGITVHSINPPSFSYGIAVAPKMRRKGAAKAALPLLFGSMKQRGFTRAVVQIEERNTASLALHASLGFVPISKSENIVTLQLDL